MLIDCALPGWGEWVEISADKSGHRVPSGSLPGWGEWVEIEAMGHAPHPA